MKNEAGGGSHKGCRRGWDHSEDDPQNRKVQKASRQTKRNSRETA